LLEDKYGMITDFKVSSLDEPSKNNVNKSENLAKQEALNYQKKIIGNLLAPDRSSVPVKMGLPQLKAAVRKKFD
jgi:hypothetical protein